ncbi:MULTISPECIES: CPBP family intramembrane glutamic endopeptidase [Bacillus]|uniref:CPBP family intramembrane glutamic endopeptidase n=1 Tax=Bacillus TaxID=1386 RepID=UPI0002E58539|nr:MULTISPECIES: CPBP family intramembrane glutamic endopeptidase [Bacillus]
MKTSASNLHFFLGLISAHILLYITYQDANVFWYLYTASILFCICFAIVIEGKKIHQSSINNMLFGVISGIALFAIFALGNYLIDLVNIKSISKDISQLYKLYSPSLLWHYLVLFIIIIPGEEIFWRGFIQKKISNHFQAKATVAISAIMYTLPMIYSQNYALILAGLVAGMVWAILYQWKNSLTLVIISHIIFDLFLLILFPLT